MAGPGTVLGVNESAAEQFQGRAKRVTITMPEDLVTAIKCEIGEREFSAYVTEAAARRYQQERLTKMLDELSEVP